MRRRALLGRARAEQRRCGCCGRRRQAAASIIAGLAAQPADGRAAASTAATRPSATGWCAVTEASLAVSAKRHAAGCAEPPSADDRRRAARPDRADHAGDRGARRPARRSRARGRSRGRPAPSPAAPRSPTRRRGGSARSSAPRPRRARGSASVTPSSPSCCRSAAAAPDRGRHADLAAQRGGDAR